MNNQEIENTKTDPTNIKIIDNEQSKKERRNMKTIKIPMLSNSGGKESGSFTMAFLSFNLVCFWLLATILAPIIFGITTVPAFSGTDAALFLTPILANYYGSKWLDGQLSKVANNNNN